MLRQYLFETTYILGLVIATVIRTWYGIQFRRDEILKKQKESSIVFVGMALWGIALFLPLFYMYTTWLNFADYWIPFPIGVLGVIIFTIGLWLLWRSHADLAKNFSPSLFIRQEHTLVTNGVYKHIRHPMYLSFWCWAIGQSLLIPNWFAGPLGIIAFSLIYLTRVKQEEKQLIEHFGDEYREYQKTTGAIFPRQLI